MASAASAEVLASASWPISAAAPEYSARRSAAERATIERRNARTAGRSALAQSCARVDLAALIFPAAERKNRFLAPLEMTNIYVYEWRPPNCSDLQRNGDGFDDVAKHGFRGFRFFLQGGVARTGDDAVRKDGDGKMLEIVGEAKVPAVEKGAGLRSALEHESAARTDAESELLGLARAIDDFESVVVETGVDFDVGDGILHGEHFADIRQGIEGIERVVSHAPPPPLPLPLPP